MTTSIQHGTPVFDASIVPRRRSVITCDQAIERLKALRGGPLTPTSKTEHDFLTMALKSDATGTIIRTLGVGGKVEIIRSRDPGYSYSVQF